MVNSSLFEDVDINAAREFAVRAHAGHLYGLEPYVVHLDAVASILAGFGRDAVIIGYLHDVIEDAGVKKEEICAAFGEFVSECVLILSDEKGSRKERKERANKKLSMVGEEYHLALIVKAADRLANVSACVNGRDTKKLSMYAREQTEFKRAVFRAGLCDEIWSRLDDLFSMAANSGLLKITKSDTPSL